MYRFRISERTAPVQGYKIFGINRNEQDNGFIFREYLPGAKQVFLIGEFNNWENLDRLKLDLFARLVMCSCLRKIC